MPYGKRTYRKRAPKRRVYRKRRGLGVKSVKKIAETVVERGRETKAIYALINQQPVYSYSQGNAGSIDSAIVFALTPNNTLTLPAQGMGGLFQGNGQGQRIGNHVQFTKGTIRMMLSCNSFNTVTNPTPQPVVVRIFVGYDKTTALGQPQTDLPDFFQDGNTSRSPSSTLSDIFSQVNTDRYTVLYTRTVKVGNAEYIGSGQNGNQQYYTNNDFKINPIVNIDFSKKMIHQAKFDDAVSTMSQRTTWCWLLMSPASGSTMIGAPMSFQCQIVNEYKDA